MLRAVVRRTVYRPSVRVSNLSRFVCAFCVQKPHQFHSTSSVHENAAATTSKHPKAATTDTVESALKKSRGKKDTNGKPKAKAKFNPKDKLKDSPKVPKEPRRPRPKAKVNAGTPARREKKSEKESENDGKMTIKTAMKPPRSTKVIEKADSLCVDDLEVQPIPIANQPEVAKLSHGLDRVLFNPGVVYLRDPRSRVFNFDPYLQKIMPVTEFNFDAISDYITSSKDTKLQALMKEHGKKYMGSTSSMTSVLSHFHYLLSAWRPINLDILSKAFSTEYRSFTALSRLPTSIFLRYKGDGTYAIDSDKELDGENILSFMGRSMEKLLTLPPEEFEKYRRQNSHTIDPEAEAEPETYHYSTFGDFLMRSQLDAHDPRLPGTGMFDLKTRAVVAVRVDVSNFHLGSGYQIKTRTGNWESFEREYFDMIRAAFLKYSLQVRMGRMDGIFVAFHNTEKIFGFQYISLDEMDAALHEGPGSGIGGPEFKMSLALFNKMLDKATARYPEKSLRIHFETRETSSPYMYMFAEPMEEDEIEEIQKGERGTVEDFMAKIKQKMLSVQQPEGDNILAETSPEDAANESELAAPGETESTEEADNKEMEDDIERLEQDEEVDEEFLKELQEQQEKSEERELVGITLATKNYVNGQEVLRPKSLGEGDKWEVSYIIGEFEAKHRAWTVYNALRLRKTKAFQSRLSSTDPEQVGGYTQYIRSLASQGRDWERHQDILDSGRQQIVYRSTKE